MYFDNPRDLVNMRSIENYIEKQIRERVDYNKYGPNFSFPGDLLVSAQGSPSDDDWSVTITVFKEDIFYEVKEVCTELDDWLKAMSDVRIYITCQMNNIF